MKDEEAHIELTKQVLKTKDGKEELDETALLTEDEKKPGSEEELEEDEDDDSSSAVGSPGTSGSTPISSSGIDKPPLSSAGSRSAEVDPGGVDLTARGRSDANYGQRFLSQIETARAGATNDVDPGGVGLTGRAGVTEQVYLGGVDSTGRAGATNELDP